MIERRRVAHLSLMSVLVVVGLAALTLYRLAPGEYGFYPVCPIHEYLRLECPGCGTTRALAALLHGHVRGAIHLNALTIGVVIPLAAGYATLAYVRAIRDRAEFRWPQAPAPLIYAGAGATLAFTVFRNL